jgi:hypothetical protein
MTAVLRGLGAPVTQNNLTKLAAVARQEGSGGTWNPFNYVVPANGSTFFNTISPGVGVQNYPDAQTGISQTIKLLSGSRDTLKAAKANLLSDAPYSGFISSFSQFYNSWGGGNINISQSSAASFLDHVIKGSGGPGDTTGTGGALPPPPTDLAGIKKWMDSHEATFNAYLKTLPTDQQQKIIGEINQPRDLAALGGYLSQAPSGVKDYYNYLSQLPADAQNAARSRLSVQVGGAFDQPGAAPADPAGSQATSKMLADLGVTYPNGPQPTPALQAFLNGLGLNLQTASDVKDRALQRIGAAADDAMLDITRTSGRNKQNITADLIRRNVVSSGESTTRYSREAEDVADDRAHVQTVEKDQKVAASDIYEQSRSLIRQQALDRAITVEQDQATQKAASNAQDLAFRRQQDASDLAFARQQQAQQDALQQQKDLIAQQASQGFAQ